MNKLTNIKAPIEDLEHNKESIVNLARELIKIPSHEQVGGKEKDISHFLRERLQEEDLEVSLQKVEQGRSNVICRLAGTGGGNSLILNGHLDTVPPMDMEKAFQPEIKDGKLYGRGAVDMKSALAAMFYSLIILRKSDITLKGDLIVTGVIDEETGGKGSAYIAENGPHADAAIVGEPTELKIIITPKGVQNIEIEVKGKAAHGSTPQNGINAILKGTKVVRAVENKLKPMLSKRQHDILGKSTMNIGVFKGGTIPNAVPDKCVIQIDRRFILGESVESIMAEMRKILDDLKTKDPELNVKFRKISGTEGFSNPPLDTPKKNFIVTKLSEAMSEVTGKKPELKGVSYWTDAASLSNIANIPSVVCGPGSIEQAHTKKEFIQISEILLAAKIYLLAAIKICGS